MADAERQPAAFPSGGSDPGWAAHLPAGLDHADVDLLAGGSLPRAWAQHWSSEPGRAVLHTDERGWMTAGELDSTTRAVAARLHAAGLGAGDHVLMSAASSADLVIAHVAALRQGLVVVPANPSYSERELRHVASDARIAAALVDDAERATCIANAAPEALVLTVAVDGPDPGRGAARALDQSAPDDPALLIYTSGTTGAPKGAVLSHGNALANAAALALAWRWSPGDRLLLALPLFHAHGLAVGLHGTLLAGASVVLQAQFSVDRVLDAAAEHDATLFFGVPTMYARLAESARVGELGSLRLCVSGSAPLPAALWETIAQRSGQQVIERYGLTETLMNTSNPYDGERRAGTVGLPLPGVELRLDASRQGEILVRGPNVFDGYWRDPEASAAAFDSEGWLRTGDLGELADDGYLRIVGRSKELIITGGYNVHPREVEEVLVRHPAVSEVAVIGLPSDEWGEVVTAVVVPRGGAEGLDEGDLMSFAASALAPYKRPRIVRIVDRLPRNALGKVLRHELVTDGHP